MQALVETQIKIDEWRGLYKESWKGVIVDEAFAHPAKFSRALVHKIYEHVVGEGWATKGQAVVDPFGGVALGAFPAMQHGLLWYGCELEEKFVALGNQNIALWNERYSRMPNWGGARLLQGDSRELVAVLGAAECCVSSPPYAGYDDHGGRATAAERDRRRLKKLRPDLSGRFDTCFKGSEEYGTTEGQLGAMKEGDHGLAVSSPPYNLPFSQDHNGSRGGGRSNGTAPSSERGAFVVYGSTPGQLEGMRGDGFEAAISSPPYEAQDVNLFCTKNQGKRFDQLTDAEKQERKNATMGNYGYRNYAAMTDGQLSAERGETFWSAARLILEQLHQVIVPGGHAVFVVKAFVRDKKIVDFPAQWAQLCEAVGFKLLHDHHALLTEHYGTQGGLHGEDRRLTVERKSFFRRLAESKGSPRIDHENVLCFERQ